MLAWYLVENYASDRYIQDLVENRETWIIPLVNPDGRDRVIP
jgi:murein tripeptide amidase MpaA